MFRRYKEIWSGILMGACMWVLDALMHITQHNDFTWGGFGREVATGDQYALIFRGLFLMISVALGSSLWRSRRRKEQINNIQALLSALRRQIANPSLLIVGYSQMLHLREGWPLSRDTIQIIKEIQVNARKINNAVECLPSPLTMLEESAISPVEVANEEAIL